MRFLCFRTMSASRIASRNSSGPSKSCTRIITLPRPWATWLSDPAPGTIRYLAANRSASSLNAVSAPLGGLHLLRDDDLDVAVTLRELPRGQRAGDLVVVRDRDRAQTLLLRGLQQHLDGSRAIARV